MDEIWEYLLNHSPKLVEKTQHKGFKANSENHLDAKPTALKPQPKHRSPLRPKFSNSKSSSSIGFQPVPSQKPVQSMLQINSITSLKTSRALPLSGKSPQSRLSTKVSATPTSSKKKIVPVLTSVKSSKLIKTSRK